MKDLTIGQILRLHATVLGVLLATAMPAFAGQPPERFRRLTARRCRPGWGCWPAACSGLRSRRRSK